MGAFLINFGASAMCGQTPSPLPELDFGINSQGT